MREVADEQALAQTLHLTGLLAWVEDGAWEHAVQLVEEGRSLAATAGAAGVVASATHMLGVIALLRGAGQDAEAYLSETLGLLDRLPADLPPFFSVVTPGWFWELGPGWAAPHAVHRDRAAVPPGRDRPGGGLHPVQPGVRGAPGGRPGAGPHPGRAEPQRLPSPG